MRSSRPAALQSNRFEKLRGGRAGQYSIRVSDEWRLQPYKLSKGVCPAVRSCLDKLSTNGFNFEMCY